MNRTPPPRIALLMTGSELVSGELTDTNSVFIARHLAEAGVIVTQKVVVGDELSMLTQVLTTLSRENDVVIVNGGLGATVDDLSAEVAASISGRKLIEHSAAVAHIARRLGEKVITEDSRFYAQLKKQAMIPESAELLDNRVGLALGFKLLLNRAICYFTPGVPGEMQEMFQQSILPDIYCRFDLRPGLKTSRLNIIGIGESQVQQLINNKIAGEMFQNVQVGFRASMSSVELKLTIHAPEYEPILEKLHHQIKLLFSEYAFSETATLPETVIQHLREQDLRVVFAESCTGGLIASQITAVPGASDVFEAGIVSYSNRSKIRILGVPESDLETFGAVSSEVAAAMVVGALEKTSADVAVAVTGIAGPTGGTEDKPVGTVYVGWGRPGDIHTRLMQIKRKRNVFQQLVSSAAIDILRRYLLGVSADSIYYFDEISRERL